MAINENIIEGKWDQVKGEVQKQWGKLTNDDLDQVQGDALKLQGKIQEQYGKSQAEAEKEVNEWNKRRNKHDAA